MRTTVLPGEGNSGEPTGAGMPTHRLEVPMPNALPFAIGTFDAMGPMARAPFPHRHTFHEIVHVTGGTGRHVVDLTGFALRPPNLCFIAPGQVHHWEGVTGLEGHVILFTDDFLLDHPGDRDLLRGLAERSWLELADEAAERTARLVAELDGEYRTGAEGFSGVLRALLHILVVRAARLPARQPAALPPPSRPGSVAAEFVALLGTPEGLLGSPAGAPHSVRTCAEHLGVSVSYLSEAVKASTGRTPGELIRQARVHEAKRLLLRTQLSVRQIAARVGFGDPAYFCRFFRRETGASPGDFRRGTGDIHHDHRLQSIARPRSRA
ncbi:helix-turn-helix domain-containing protein [Streptomyces sp. BG9H]|uniref:Helix-turn-helix domain-containing protein n=1 Tax=Streptomyces anatolicus TaxID=2675858 RepID=A0ABS6YMY8_9ACTN|nr:AraC family transcriptional regulator [Streptomyces anatolicus]MBW5422796.1 helix-turn-helix domain-containing protein [Streptomyces anatolicus]